MPDNGESRLSLEQIEARCPVIVDREEFYRRLEAWGLSYGPAFRCVERIRKGSGEALARVRLPKIARALPFRFHPALLDGCLQTIGALLPSDSARRRTFVPASLRALKVVSDREVTDVWAHAVVRSGTAESEEIECALTISDDTGKVLASVDALSARGIERKEHRQVAATDNLFYRLVWDKQVPVRSRRSLEGTDWLIVGSDDRTAPLSRRLTDAGGRCRSARSARPADEPVSGSSPRGVVYFAEPHPDPIAGYESSCRDVLELVHSLTDRGSAETELWLVTRGARWINGDGAQDAIGNAGIWGLGAVIALEHPELRCVRVDLQANSPPEDCDNLFAEIASATNEREIGFRGGARMAARLERAERQQGSPLLLRRDATYLITGGLGALGLRLADWAVERGAGHLVLAGRRAVENDRTRLLRARGVDVTVRALDAANGRAVGDLLGEIDSAMPPLRGIVHAAGVLDDGILREQTGERFSRVMEPKVAGAWNLHRATELRELDFFILFSSVAAVFGSPGQSNYAAANAAMDAVAHYRRSLGLRAATVNWGPWAEAGMAASAASGARRRWGALGLQPLPAARALEALESMIAHHAEEAQLLAVDVDWATLFGQFSGASPPLLSRLQTETGASSVKPAFLEQLRAQPGPARKETIVSRLRAEAAKLLGVPPGDVDARRPLKDFGLDSLAAIELRSVAGRILGRTLPATLLFDYPTLEALATHLSADPARAPEVSLFAGASEAIQEGRLDQLTALSDEEAEALLLSRLEAMGR
jgi:myxalamid-type polyketide synthase MxaE and MxaD